MPEPTPAPTPIDDVISAEITWGSVTIEVEARDVHVGALVRLLGSEERGIAPELDERLPCRILWGPARIRMQARVRQVATIIRSLGTGEYSPAVLKDGAEKESAA